MKHRTYPAPPRFIVVDRRPRATPGYESWLKIYANLQFPKTPKSISHKLPYRSVTKCVSRCSGQVVIRLNSWDAQLAVSNDPKYARLKTNLGIEQAKKG
ncbi:hypothetical protein TNCV_2247591 [Trichonephila clavipes]|nr:hypothetical protein TNCV_2247591 [Trichonephila clavipes]